MLGIEILKGLWCGDAEYWERHKDRFGYVIHACKEPYHRKAVNYRSRSAPLDSLEYLRAVRGNEVSLNLVDSEDVSYINDVVMIDAIGIISDKIKDHETVMVHCNKGRSRGPGIVLGYMRFIGIYDHVTYDEAKERFREIYPAYAPGGGIDLWLYINWHNLKSR